MRGEKTIHIQKTKTFDHIHTKLSNQGERRTVGSFSGQNQWCNQRALFLCDEKNRSSDTTEKSKKHTTDNKRE